jgi:Flp pilus assembly protein TadB
VAVGVTVTVAVGVAVAAAVGVAVAVAVAVGVTVAVNRSRLPSRATRLSHPLHRVVETRAGPWGVGVPDGDGVNRGSIRLKCDDLGRTAIILDTAPA